MSPQKRIQHLRSKNKLLLDKLESHSSIIEAELKYLKRTMRGTADRSPSCNDTGNKNWAKRNNSRQVNEALSSCSKAASPDSVPNKCTLTSRGKNCVSANLERGDETDCKNVDSINRSVKSKRTAYSHLRVTHRRKNTVDSPIHNSKPIRDIISLIDYSPKSTFLKRMKSKCKPYTREVYVRVSKKGGNLRHAFHEEEGSEEEKKKRRARDVEGAPRQKARLSDEAHMKGDPHLSFRSSLCADCGKKIERQPVPCTCGGAGLESEELGVHGRVNKKEELERLKDFRERNWQDCHADPCKCESTHCCEHHDCGTEVYGINDRLLAVPLNQQCENLVHCSPCCQLKNRNSCCSNSKRVVVTVPITLLDGSALDSGKGKRMKAAKENIPVSKEVLKKLQRPVPQNSMALRFQKGVC